METQSQAGIGDLIVILDKVDETCRWDSTGRRAAPLLLPAVVLPLIQIAPLDRGDELLRSAAIVGVVGLVSGRSGRRSAL